jgi:hypothetical protein
MAQHLCSLTFEVRRSPRWSGLAREWRINEVPVPGPSRSAVGCRLDRAVMRSPIDEAANDRMLRRERARSP